MTDQTGTGQEITFTDEQQAHINKIIGAARIKEREKFEAKAKEDQAKAVSDAAQAKLLADKNWQELDATRLTRISELEPFEAEAKAYRELVSGMLKDRIKALGDQAKKAVGALPASLTDVERLAWLNKNEALFKTSGGSGVGTPGQGTAPKGRAKGEQLNRVPIRL